MNPKKLRIRHHKEEQILLIYSNLFFKGVKNHLTPLSLTLEQANEFLKKYLETKPDEKLLKTIRNYVKPISLSHSDKDINAQRKQKILDYCIDIGAAAVHVYPYSKNERFMAEEKKLLKELIDSL